MLYSQWSRFLFPFLKTHDLAVLKVGNPNINPACTLDSSWIPKERRASLVAARGRLIAMGKNRIVRAPMTERDGKTYKVDGKGKVQYQYKEVQVGPTLRTQGDMTVYQRAGYVFRGIDSRGKVDVSKVESDDEYVAGGAGDSGGGFFMEDQAVGILFNIGAARRR